MGFRLRGEYERDVRASRRGDRGYWEVQNERPQRTGKKKSEISLERVTQRLLLERQDLDEKVAETRREFGKLARRKLVLEEEWKKLRVDRANLQEDKKRFQAARRSPWFQSNILPTSDLGRVRINVGGQLFETSERVLKRDPGSLLAALVQEDSPLQPDESGCFVIDRDWNLFRHILAFLRDGTLPCTGADRLIAELYKEADYYNIETLRCAIREYLDPHHIVEKSAAIPLSQLHKLEATLKKSLRKKGFSEGEYFVDDGFPESSDESSGDEKEKEKKKEPDWWTSERYQGNDFGRKKYTVPDPPGWRPMNKKKTANTFYTHSTWKRGTEESYFSNR